MNVIKHLLVSNDHDREEYALLVNKSGTVGLAAEEGIPDDKGALHFLHCK